MAEEKKARKTRLTKHETYRFIRDEHGETLARCNFCEETYDWRQAWNHKCNPEKVAALQCDREDEDAAG